VSLVAGERIGSVWLAIIRVMVPVVPIWPSVRYPCPCWKVCVPVPKSWLFQFAGWPFPVKSS